MVFSTVSGRALRDSPHLVVRAVREATLRQAAVFAAVALAVGIGIGFATVLIPNDVFGRDIAPVAWDYPVLVITALLSGMLAATFVDRDSADQGVDGSARFGLIGTVVSWLAVGCPVCNKLALLAFGYAGAQTWFAPFQPVLAVVGIALLWLGLAVRLHTANACPAPRAAA